mmetsp:Transcript_9366/g.23197  ORF Transcript_9366/g.23197 Transcript_9366/m.23197 type:complete len:234 (-) Transcript_9366:616-1317(-)
MPSGEKRRSSMSAVLLSAVRHMNTYEGCGSTPPALATVSCMKVSSASTYGLGPRGRGPLGVHTMAFSPSPTMPSTRADTRRSSARSAATCSARNAAAATPSTLPPGCTLPIRPSACLNPRRLICAACASPSCAPSAALALLLSCACTCRPTASSSACSARGAACAHVNRSSSGAAAASAHASATSHMSAGARDSATRPFMRPTSASTTTLAMRRSRWCSAAAATSQGRSRPDR